MNPVTIIWSMVASACLTLAAMNLLVWLKERAAWSYLLISVMAAGTAGIAFCELSMMLATTPAEFGHVVWWANFPVWMVVVSLVLFVRLYLRSGRVWLAWTIIGMRTLALILNFVLTPNLNYREITSLQHLRFFGESVSVARGVPNPWQLIAQVAVLLLMVFIVDAAVSVRRRQDQRRSLVLLSAILFFLVASLMQSVLVFWGIFSMPITFSFFSLGIVSVMAYEMSRDVYRSTQLAQNLGESEARMKDIIFSMGDWVWEVDEKWVYTYSSEKGKELFGPVIGKTPFDLMPPDEAERVKSLISETAEQKALIRDLENWNIGKDGERICLLTNGVPILDEAGNLKGYRGVDKDITERKLAETARREDMARYEAVVDAFDGFIYICSQDYRVEFMNQRLIERTGRNAVGEPCYMALHDSDSVCEWCVNEKVFQGETVRWEVQSPKDRRWYYVVNTPIRHADGTLSKQSMIMDITERKQAEEALKVNETALRNSKNDLQRLAGRLISAQEEELRRLSRELHDDLTQRLAVLAIEAGKLELDLEKRPDVQGNAVERIVRIKDQLIKVSEDVHNISRQIHPTILDDLGLVRAIESECAMFLRRHSITPSFIKDHVPDAIPDDIALCLYRVVQEGLRNIAVHSRAKSCKIVLHLSGDAICLAVTDDGVGFDPLKVRNTPGLGLSSMRERVQLVEGDFAIRSQPGKGTEITVCVPFSGGNA
jgi:two-component system, NarL family, sensor histidine kinase UhpB